MIKPLVRRALRSLAFSLLGRPLLANVAKQMVRRIPALDRRLRRLVGVTPVVAPEPELPPGPIQIPPEVARVLADLRQALHERERSSP